MIKYLVCRRLNVEIWISRQLPESRKVDHEEPIGRLILAPKNFRHRSHNGRSRRLTHDNLIVCSLPCRWIQSLQVILFSCEFQAQEALDTAYFIPIFHGRRHQLHRLPNLDLETAGERTFA